MNRQLLQLSFLLLASFALSASASDVGENIMDGFRGASEFMFGLYYVVGFAFIFTAINKLKKLGHRTAFMNVDSGITGPLALLAIGACLMFLPIFLEVVNKTILGTENVMSYAQEGDSLLDKLRPVIMLVQFIGMIAMLRGFLILTKVTGQGAQPGTISKGLVHIFGGILAVNIVQTMEIMTNTFGISI